MSPIRNRRSSSFETNNGVPVGPSGDGDSNTNVALTLATSILLKQQQHQQHQQHQAQQLILNQQQMMNHQQLDLQQNMNSSLDAFAITQAANSLLQQQFHQQSNVNSQLDSFALSLTTTNNSLNHHQQHHQHHHHQQQQPVQDNMKLPFLTMPHPVQQQQQQQQQQQPMPLSNAIMNQANQLMAIPTQLPPNGVNSHGTVNQVETLLQQLQNPMSTLQSARSQDAWNNVNLEGNNNPFFQLSNPIALPTQPNNRHFSQELLLAQTAVLRGQNNESNTITPPLLPTFLTAANKTAGRTASPPSTFHEQTIKVSSDEEAFINNYTIPSEDSFRKIPSRSEVWNEMLVRLMCFKNERGHCSVPQAYSKDTKLGNWVKHQRVSFAQGRLSPSHKEILDGIGFRWTVNDSWDDMYDRLSSYKKEHGDCLVPCNYEVDRKLGRWVDNQRQHRIKKVNSMSPDRIERLNALGFVWKVELKTLWDAMFQRLKRYKEMYGDCRVPVSYEKDPQLGRWVEKQRSRMQDLSIDYFSQLDSVDFSW